MSHRATSNDDEIIELSCKLRRLQITVEGPAAEATEFPALVAPGSSAGPRAPPSTSDRSFEVVSSAASEVVAPRFPEHRHQIAASFGLFAPVCLLDLASRFPGGRHRSCSISSEGRIERA